MPTLIGWERVPTGTNEPLLDTDVVYRWHAQQWEEQLPLVGDDGHDYPHFGVFVAQMATA